MARKSPLDQLRKICLALPEATEKEAWGEPTFRVRDKLFAMFSNNHHGDGRIAVWCKAPPGVQEIVVSAVPTRFFVPPYVGHKGWVGINLTGSVDWKEVAEFMADSYRLTAPKRLLR
jgi:predicted DNA-binding protein (MmcQ/YjbR family)